MPAKVFKGKSFAALSLICLLYFITFFAGPEKNSSRITFILIGAFAIFAFIFNQLQFFKDPDAAVSIKDAKYRTGVLIGFASLFGLIAVLANYDHYIEYQIPTQIIVIPLLFLSTGIVFINIFIFCRSLIAKLSEIKEGKPFDPFLCFVCCFAILATTYLIVFILCSYPGQICSDSMNQIHQVMTGNYSNHHPVYQTWLIGLFYNIGYAIFADVNAGVATYTIFQIIFMAATFAFTISTIIEAGGRKAFAAVWFIWFLITPCHIIFSFTLWKDSLYGAVVCLFTTALFRIVKKVGKQKFFDYGLLFVSGVGFCILRSNGLPGFIIFLAVFAVISLILKHVDTKLLIVFAAALLVAIIMKYPVLKAMNIPQADTVEMLSIPVQQVARIARDSNDFTDSERAVLEQVVPIDSLKEAYNPKIYDYARDSIRYGGNQQYINEHPFECFGTWFTVVMRHPVLATRAWVDQTSGYWNPCSYYWMKWWDGVCAEDGVWLEVNSPVANEWFHAYVRQFTENNIILMQSYNVGLHVWIVLFCAAYAIYEKRRDYLYLLPALSLVATLLIATLMHDEFRFGYPVYTCLPIIAFSCLAYKDKTAEAKPETQSTPRNDRKKKSKSSRHK